MVNERSPRKNKKVKSSVDQDKQYIVERYYESRNKK